MTASLLVGAIPAVYLGARLSATGANRFVRPVLAVVLLASALKLVNVATSWTLAACAVWVAVNLAAGAYRRRSGDGVASDGFEPYASREEVGVVAAVVLDRPDGACCARPPTAAGWLRTAGITSGHES